MAGDRLSGSKRKADSGAAAASSAGGGAGASSSAADGVTAAARLLEGETRVVSGLSDARISGTIKANADGKTPAQRAHEEVLARRVC